MKLCTRHQHLLTAHPGDARTILKSGAASILRRRLRRMAASSRVGTFENS
jgi:hypothetical protein